MHIYRSVYLTKYDANVYCRKRLLSSICSTEEMQALSTSSRYNLLKRNLVVTELFTNIAAVNFMKNEELMMEFVLGESDLLQWKVI